MIWYRHPVFVLYWVFCKSKWKSLAQWSTHIAENNGYPIIANEAEEIVRKYKKKDEL